MESSRRVILGQRARSLVIGASKPPKLATRQADGFDAVAPAARRAMACTEAQAALGEGAPDLTVVLATRQRGIRREDRIATVDKARPAGLDFLPSITSWNPRLLPPPDQRP